MPTTLPAPMSKEEALNCLERSYPSEPQQLDHGAWIYPIDPSVVESAVCEVLKCAVIVSPKGIIGHSYVLKISGLNTVGDLTHAATRIQEQAALELMSRSGFDVAVSA